MLHYPTIPLVQNASLCSILRHRPGSHKYVDKEDCERAKDIENHTSLPGCDPLAAPFGYAFLPVKRMLLQKVVKGDCAEEFMRFP